MKQQKGFTLMELMVTAGIIAILSAIAVPAYGEYVKRSRIPQATNNLSSMRVKLEQYYQDNRKYKDACKDGTIAPLPKSDDFVYSCTLDTNTFSVKAEGKGGMAGFTYTIDQSNNMKTISLPTGWGTASADNPLPCWVRKKGETC